MNVIIVFPFQNVYRKVRIKCKFTGKKVIIYSNATKNNVTLTHILFPQNKMSQLNAEQH
jgi:hypothetical protein